jgi:protein-S-isoprenylcysteine O-methyltransferase Ste14
MLLCWRAMPPKVLLQSLGFALVLGLLLFLPAGTLAWAQGWIFLALFCGCSFATGAWLRKADPALFAERTKSPMGGDQRPRDRAVMMALMLGLAGWVVVMALDARRFGWSEVPLWAEALGAVLILAAFLGWVTVLRVNSFAATRVRLQPERGQTVISTGPYGAVRHPMYAYGLLLMIGAPLLLGSLWGLLGLALFVPLLAARLLGEEAMLRAGLPGYRDYAAKVRYRLVPGIW